MAESSSCVFTVETTRPFCTPALLAYLRVRAVGGVELVDGLRYRRALRVKGTEGILTIDLENAEREGTVVVQYSSSLESEVETLREVVDRLVDATAPIEEIDAVLGQDPILAPLVQRRPGVRIPGTTEPFELAVRAILGQQISVAAATTLAGRIAARWGTMLSTPEAGLIRIFPEADELADAVLERVGLSRTKATAIRHLGAAVAEGQIDLTPVRTGERPELETLLAIPGIGPWTASYIALRGLRDRDSIPANDLGIRNALSYGSAREVAVAAERWRPWRGYGAIHLWSTYLPL